MDARDRAPLDGASPEGSAGAPFDNAGAPFDNAGAAGANAGAAGANAGAAGADPPQRSAGAPLDTAGARELLERLALSAVGAVALTAERADAIAEELADRGVVRRDEARALVEELSSRWRGDATRLGERVGATFDALFRELGLVTRDDLEELELRLAQLEHRLSLLER